MKRFYCTICKRVKRVRVMPSSVPANYDADSGEEIYKVDVRSREGVCSWHRASFAGVRSNVTKIGAK